MDARQLPGQELSPAAREFLQEPRFATVATIGTDGTPHLTVLWFAIEDDGTVLLNGAAGRRWCANLARDPRVTVAVPNGYDYVELRGRVEIDADRDRGLADIERLAHRYLGDARAVEASMERYRRQERISYRFRPARVRERFGEG